MPITTKNLHALDPVWDEMLADRQPDVIIITKQPIPVPAGGDSGSLWPAKNQQGSLSAAENGNQPPLLQE